MKMEKREWSVGMQLFMGKTIPGVLWIGAGISGLFRTPAANIINALFLAAAVISLVALLRARAEKYDEMAENNLMLAKAKTRDVMHYVYCISACVLAITFGFLEQVDWSLPCLIRGIFFCLMGIQDLLTGIIFRKMEAE